MDFQYKKYSLENLEKWLNDAMSSAEATPQEIYDTIKKVVREEYYYHKDKTSKTYELLSLLGDRINSIPSAFGKNVIDFTNLGSSDTFTFSTKADDTPSLTIGDWDKKNYYPEEELNEMCDKEVSQQEKEKCREYNLREAEYYDKRAKLDVNPGSYQDYIGWENLTSNDFDKIFPIPKMDKVAKWVLPVEVDGLTGDCVVNLPDDLLERVGWVEGDTIEFLSNPSGSFTVKKVVKPEVENI
jgi:hypothetical protein